MLEKIINYKLPFHIMINSKFRCFDLNFHKRLDDIWGVEKTTSREAWKTPQIWTGISAWGTLGTGSLWEVKEWINTSRKHEIYIYILNVQFHFSVSDLSKLLIFFSHASPLSFSCHCQYPLLRRCSRYLLFIPFVSGFVSRKQSWTPLLFQLLR